MGGRDALTVVVKVYGGSAHKAGAAHMTPDDAWNAKTTASPATAIASKVLDSDIPRNTIELRQGCPGEAHFHGNSPIAVNLLSLRISFGDLVASRHH